MTASGLTTSTARTAGLPVSALTTELRDDSFREFTAPFRYVSPAEFDLIARIAGMTLEHRWAWWDPLTVRRQSGLHVSVWRLPEA